MQNNAQRNGKKRNTRNHRWVKISDGLRITLAAKPSAIELKLSDLCEGPHFKLNGMGCFPYTFGRNNRLAERAAWR